MFLGELTQPVGDLDGIGPAAVRDLSNLGVRSIADLLRHYPLRYEDRKTPVPIASSSSAIPALTTATVLRHETFRWKRGNALKVIVDDGSAQGTLLCYGRNFLAGKLPPGIQIRLAAPFELKFGERQSGSFAFEPLDQEPSGDFDVILPIYPLGGSLNQRNLRKAIRRALEAYARGLRNEVPSSLLTLAYPAGKELAIKTIHFPESIEEAKKVRKGLVFEELFHLQWTVLNKGRAEKIEERPWSTNLIDRLLPTLPFQLTKDQLAALSDIESDMSRSIPMTRLLQGEVGSGKTLVAFLAALGVIAAGRQTAFMAPTELLARQHADNAAKLLEPFGVRVAYLTGIVSGEQRRQLTEALAQGQIDLAVGTHALFSQDVEFRDLSLAIVDEQHRFGVEQRKALTEKGRNVDFLALSATPIPRTLALTAFGDMDVSTIRTMPKGRLPVETHLARMGNESKVYSFIAEELRRGNRAYFVYPLIEESDKSDLKDAEGMFQRLSQTVFPDHRCALVHSRIDEETKRRTMESFRDGKLDILVATSVVEVGVDVPEATCMVVEHAERFGLSALHQLRGRVGRGERQSYCFLVYAEPLSDDGKRRMMTMRKSNDGFQIAEEDLKMRGPGDLAGRRQSGFLKLRIANPVADLKVLLEARELAHSLLTDDPGLLLPENRDLRDLFFSTPPFDDDLIAAG